MIVCWFVEQIEGTVSGHPSAHCVPRPAHIFHTVSAFAGLLGPLPPLYSSYLPLVQRLWCRWTMPQMGPLSREAGDSFARWAWIKVGGKMSMAGWILSAQWDPNCTQDSVCSYESLVGKSGQGNVDQVLTSWLSRRRLPDLLPYAI